MRTLFTLVTIGVFLLQELMIELGADTVKDVTNSTITINNNHNKTETADETINKNKNRTNETFDDWQQAPVKSDLVQLVALDASRSLNKDTKDDRYRKLIHLHQARRKEEVGMKYNLTMDLAVTTCKKNDTRYQGYSCVLDPHEMIERCTVIVWERVWLMQRQVLNFDCVRYQTYDVYFSEKSIMEDRYEHDVNSYR